MTERHIIRITILASILAILYWGLLASDRYVSEAHVIVQDTESLSGSVTDVTGLLGGMAGSNTHADQLLLRDHLRSVDMLLKLDAKLDLRAHYSDTRHDLLSRMWDRDEPLEWFHSYYLSRVSIEYDEVAGLLVIQSQAYDADFAHAITAALVEEGERFMNAMAHGLAQDQVHFMEQQVELNNRRVLDTLKAVLEFQNREGMVSPQGTAENLVSIINSLEVSVTQKRAERAAMLGYRRAESSEVRELDMYIAAIQDQIDKAKAKLASPTGTALNETVAEFQRVQLEAELAQDIYKTALVALETGRAEAMRTLRKVVVLQSPTQPQYPMEPRRIYSVVVFMIVAFLLAGIFHLLAMIIRDHRD